ncbi:hypothetical protein GCM10010277_76920 [Streptomyces longisporoflavus]|uniref:hypothetical protein n=1 Tax=Streptomyces longisporoflavus TaxID=28044 RepID=UPI00167E8EBF|nr:hypothetical protein [Streptomyces longisporoflavus]GGV67978.1 hypothetical protein GCM10010277_76920 [Streptomyces longisporoflavus]
MAFFGNDNADLLRQVLGQLAQIGSDLSALKQQASDQQLAIDQIRQDATAALNSGLSENRAVIREGLARANETVSGPLTHLSTELVAIRSSISRLDHHAKTVAAPPPPTPQERSPAPEPPPVQDQKPEASAPAKTTAAGETILRAAAGISAATLQAHRDTWEFLVKHAGPDQHFHVPGAVTIQNGSVTAAVSGPSLVAAITSLGDVSRTGDTPGTRAIAAHLHARLTDTVRAVVENPHQGRGAEPVAIVIDDRAAAERTSEGNGRPDNEPDNG